MKTGLSREIKQRIADRYDGEWDELLDVLNLDMGMFVDRFEDEIAEVLEELDIADMEEGEEGEFDVV